MEASNLTYLSCLKISELSYIYSFSKEIQFLHWQNRESVLKINRDYLLHRHFITLRIINIQNIVNVVDWIGLAQDTYRWRALVNSVMNLRVP
jgi:hypothetical protein